MLQHAFLARLGNRDIILRSADPAVTHQFAVEQLRLFGQFDRRVRSGRFEPSRMSIPGGYDEFRVLWNRDTQCAYKFSAYDLASGTPTVEGTAVPSHLLAPPAPPPPPAAIRFSAYDLASGTPTVEGTAVPSHLLAPPAPPPPPAAIAPAAAPTAAPAVVPTLPVTPASLAPDRETLFRGMTEMAAQREYRNYMFASKRRQEKAGDRVRKRPRTRTSTPVAAAGTPNTPPIASTSGAASALTITIPARSPAAPSIIPPPLPFTPDDAAATTPLPADDDDMGLVDPFDE